MMKKLSCQVVAKPQQKGKEMGRLYIVCKSKKEESMVLEKLEKQGKKWRSDEKPTEKSYFIEEYKDFAIIIDEKNKLAYTRQATSNMRDYKDCKKISATEFLKENKETIAIYRNGSETIALEKNTGRKAVAKCHADDKYNFEIGAKLALKRLFPEPVREVDRYAEVGEYIKITNPIGAIGKYKKGDIFRVKKAYPPTKDTIQYVKCYGANIVIRYDEYVVLENYKPEEKPQQYYNGKVVCTKVAPNPCVSLTKGKIYEIINGSIIFDDGINSTLNITSVEELNNKFVSQFIELVE